MTTSYLSTKLQDGGDVETSIMNRKVFDLAWPDSVGLNTVATKAMLQGYYNNLENKQRFKEQIEVLEAYTGAVLFTSRRAAYTPGYSTASVTATSSATVSMTSSASIRFDGILGRSIVSIALFKQYVEGKMLR